MYECFVLTDSKFTTLQGHTISGVLVPSVLPGQAAQQGQRRSSAGPQGIPQLPQQPSPTDMTAFNKLLGMMKQAGTLGQAQKEMVCDVTFIFLPWIYLIQFNGTVAVRICKNSNFWLIWYSTKRVYVIMIWPSCIVVGVIGVGDIGIISICAQPS